MSKPQFSNSNNVKSASTTPFCKVCKDAGLPSSTYTSHYVKDQPGPNGKVVCPTLLNQACRVCGEHGHTSSYCAELKRRREYRSSSYHQESDRYRRRGEEEEEEEKKYYNQRQHHHQEQPSIRSGSGRYYQDRDISFNRLDEDTQRHEREVEERSQRYYHEQSRQTKPFLQAALKQPQQRHHHTPYAHPHGPRVRIEIESRALSAGAAHTKSSQLPSFKDHLAANNLPIDLNHSENWGDEENTPFVCDPEKMMLEFAKSFITESRVTDEEFDFIKACDNDDNENCFPEEA